MVSDSPTKDERCHACGMPLPGSNEQFIYHPYAACLMYRGCGDPRIVQANLDAVIAHGYQLAYEENPPVRREDVV